MLMTMIFFMTGLSSGVESVILEHPRNARVPLNSTVFLTCIVSVETDMQVTWMKNGFGLGETREDVRNFSPRRRYGQPAYDLPNSLTEGNYNLQISSVQLSDEGIYQCQQNLPGSGLPNLSDRAYLFVQVPAMDPEIQLIDNSRKLSPSSDPAVVRDGDSLTLECSALGGKPGAQLVWFLDGTRIVPDDKGEFKGPLSGKIHSYMEKSKQKNILNDSHSQLTLHVNRLHQGKMIECRAFNEGYDDYPLVKPAKKVIEVHYAPEVTMRVEPSRVDLTYKEREKITFRCEAHGRPDRFYWEWFVNGARIDNLNEKVYHVTITRSMDQATIQCSANNKEMGYASIKISVLYAPQFVEDLPPSYAAFIDESVTMSCAVKSNPASVIKWRKENTSSPVIHEGENLTIKNVQKIDFALYLCTANNQHFRTVQRQILLGQKGPPRIHSASEIFARKGKPVRIPCLIESVPVPRPQEISWEKSGKPILDASGILFTPHISGVESSVVLTEVRASDFTIYNCSVRNEHGTDWKLIKLVQKEEYNETTLGVIGAALCGVLFILLSLICVYYVCLRKSCRKKSLQNENTPRLRGLNGSNSVRTADTTDHLDSPCKHVFGQWSAGGHGTAPHGSNMTCPMHGCANSDKLSSDGGGFFRTSQEMEERGTPIFYRNGSLGHNYRLGNVPRAAPQFMLPYPNDKMVFLVDDENLLKEEGYNYNAPFTQQQVSQLPPSYGSNSSNVGFSSPPYPPSNSTTATCLCHQPIGTSADYIHQQGNTNQSTETSGYPQYPQHPQHQQHLQYYQTHCQYQHNPMIESVLRTPHHQQSSVHSSPLSHLSAPIHNVHQTQAHCCNSPIASSSTSVTTQTVAHMSSLPHACNQTTPNFAYYSSNNSGNNSLLGTMYPSSYPTPQMYPIYYPGMIQGAQGGTPLMHRHSPLDYNNGTADTSTLGSVGPPIPPFINYCLPASNAAYSLDVCPTAATAGVLSKQVQPHQAQRPHLSKSLPNGGDEDDSIQQNGENTQLNEVMRDTQGKSSHQNSQKKASREVSQPSTTTASQSNETELSMKVPAPHYYQPSQDPLPANLVNGTTPNSTRSQVPNNHRNAKSNVQ